MTASIVAVLAFITSVMAVCAFATPIGRRLAVLDHPDGGRKTHPRPTPLVGGIALMGPLVIAVLAHAWLYPDRAGLFLALATAGLAFLLMGLLDDRHHLAPVPRLAMSFVLALVLMLAEPSLVLQSLDFGPLFGVVPLGAMAIPFTMVCIVGFQNAVNMADGRNGLALALSIFWAFCLLVYAPAHLNLIAVLLLAGAAVVFPYNWRGRLFLGDAGSFSIGALVALSMVHTYNTSPFQLTALSFVLWLLIPVVDCLRLMVQRSLAGRSPFAPDTDHLHHRLGRLWAWPKALLVYLALAAAPSLADLMLDPTATFFIILGTLAAYAFVLHRTRPSAEVQAAE
jgi:UDP-GlcNAc:undecaprenyl-phosphate/decaprenyl-phosphate GlcNAc-1-phosphate transferase